MNIFKKKSKKIVNNAPQPENVPKTTKGSLFMKTIGMISTINSSQSNAESPDNSTQNMTTMNTSPGVTPSKKAKANGTDAKAPKVKNSEPRAMDSKNSTGKFESVQQQMIQQQLQQQLQQEQLQEQLLQQQQQQFQQEKQQQQQQQQQQLNQQQTPEKLNNNLKVPKVNVAVIKGKTKTKSKQTEPGVTKSKADRPPSLKLSSSSDRSISDVPVSTELNIIPKKKMHVLENEQNLMKKEIEDLRQSFSSASKGSLAAAKASIPQPVTVPNTSTNSINSPTNAKEIFWEVRKYFTICLSYNSILTRQICSIISQSILMYFLIHK